MDLRITDIKDDLRAASGFFHTDDLSEANLLRRAILSEIETYTIEFAKYDVNTSIISDEELAAKLGALIIDQRAQLSDKLIETWLAVDFTATRDGVNFMSYDLTDQTGLTFVGNSLLVTLLRGQRLRFSIKVRAGKSNDHVKWRPVPEFAFKPVVDGRFVVPRKTKIDITSYYTARITILDNQSGKSDLEIAQALTNLTVNYNHFKANGKNEVEFKISSDDLFHEQLWMYNYDPNFPKTTGPLSVNFVLKQGNGVRNITLFNGQELGSRKLTESLFVKELIIYESDNIHMDGDFLAKRISELKLKANIEPGTYRFNDVKITSLLQDHDLFEFHLPIGRIQNNQKLIYDLVIEVGVIPVDIGWSEPNKNEFDGYNGYYFQFMNPGMLTAKQIFEKGFNTIYAAACAKSDTLFTHQVIPADMILPEGC